MNYSLKDTDVVILCGGKGERLRSVLGDVPKALVQINGRAFIDILLDNLSRCGFRKFILCVGHLKEKVKEHFLAKTEERKYSLLFSEEEVPLGTGGALKRVESLINGDIFFAMNGDSLCGIDFEDFFKFHKNKNALFSMALTTNHDREDVGFVSVDNHQRINSFSERKNIHSAKYSNIGMYFFSRDIFSYMPNAESFSLEEDFFPEMVHKQIYGYVVGKELIDIGTPQRYIEAQRNKTIG